MLVEGMARNMMMWGGMSGAWIFSMIFLGGGGGWRQGLGGLKRQSEFYPYLQKGEEEIAWFTISVFCCHILATLSGGIILAVNRWWSQAQLVGCLHSLICLFFLFLIISISLMIKATTEICLSNCIKDTYILKTCVLFMSSDSMCRRPPPNGEGTQGSNSKPDA